MSDSDSPKDKKTEKPLSAIRQLKNLLNGLLNEEGIPEKDRVPPEDTAWIHRMLKDINSSRMGEADAANFLNQLRGDLEPSWAKNPGKRSARVVSIDKSKER
jgi:hypothetical protein